MNRPWQVWSIFALCSLVVVAATAWLTVHALEADRARVAARAEAGLEQDVNSALWRMDTMLAPLIAEEIARPHFFYEPFIMLDGDAEPSGVAQQQTAIEAVPSPLLTGPETNVILNFSCSATGEWSSPQAPPEKWTALANSNGLATPEIELNKQRLTDLAAMVDIKALIAQLPEQPLPQPQAWETIASTEQGDDNSVAAYDTAADFSRLYSNRSYSYGVDPPEQQPAAVDGANPFATDADVEQQLAQVQQQGVDRGAEFEPLSRGQQAGAATERQDAYGRSGYGPGVPREPKATPRGGYGGGKGRAQSAAEYADRDQRVQEATQKEFLQQRKSNNYMRAPQRRRQTSPVIENVSRPLWVGDQLLLARRVVREGQTVVQGSWLDWPGLKQQLLSEAADVLPTADLVPVRQDDGEDPARDLAGLPVRLIVPDLSSTTIAASSPLRWALSVTWGALGVALAAVGGLLAGVVSLSERRAAFVSSVTHELRTPLTTFRMYADLLSNNMAPSEERRREYTETLSREAQRLTHLVENVLAYARLERGRKPQRTDRTTAAALLERFEPRLAERAQQVGMQLVCQLADDARDAPLLTDAGVVEQILFNLVDNAAKYAGRATDRRIHVEATRAGGRLELSVRDHGPGFADVRDLQRARAFHKSAQQAAETAPGVGLGLALCRRLASQIGGRLRAAPAEADKQGARVSLSLPIER